MDIGWGELLIILIVALLVVGPDKLPYYARKAAKFVRNFQKVTSGLTGQISKAMDLDDEDGKSSNFKKDLIEVKKSLEKDVADLKASLNEQSEAISKSMESGTKEAAAQLEKNAREISDTLNTQASELKTTLDTQVKAVSETVNSGVQEAAAALDDSAAAVTAAASPTIEAPKDEPLPTPVIITKSNAVTTTPPDATEIS